MRERDRSMIPRQQKEFPEVLQSIPRGFGLKRIY